MGSEMCIRDSPPTRRPTRLFHLCGSRHSRTTPDIQSSHRSGHPQGDPAHSPSQSADPASLCRVSGPPPELGHGPLWPALTSSFTPLGRGAKSRSHPFAKEGAVDEARYNPCITSKRALGAMHNAYGLLWLWPAEDRGVTRSFPRCNTRCFPLPGLQTGTNERS